MDEETNQGAMIPAAAGEYTHGFSTPTDMRTVAMSLPPEQMLVVFGQYVDRRTAFREWVKNQLRQGIHYGFPPGCEPKVDSRGWFGVWMKGAYEYYPPEQWTPKESLYAAGADFLCDLLGLRDAYKTDMSGWKQLGEPKGVFVYACKLYSRANGALVSEGRGTAKVGEKKRDENAAMKCAKKSAKVDAILNAYGLRDLFTQDEPPTVPKHENPERNAAAPKARTRSERKAPQNQVTKDELIAAFRDFECFDESGDAKKAFPEFVFKATGLNFDARYPENWTREAMDLVQDAIASSSGDPSAQG